MSTSKSTTIWRQISESVKDTVEARTPVGDDGYTEDYDCKLHFAYTPTPETRDLFVPEYGSKPLFKAEILLRYNDTYTVREWVIDTWSANSKIVQELDGTYFDMLDDIVLEFAGYRECEAHEELRKAKEAARRPALEPATGQMSLFDDTDTLPLFSGTAVRVTIEENDAPTTSAQQMTFSKCPTCHDTGKVGDRYCWCQAGQDARKLDAEMTKTQQQASLYARSCRKMNGRAGMLEL